MDYIFSPIVIVLLIIIILSVVIGIRQSRMINSEGDVRSGTKRAPMLFLLAVMTYFVIAYWDASLIHDRLITDKIFPMFVSGVSIIACLVCLVKMILRPEGDVIFADREVRSPEEQVTHGLWPTLGWFAFLLVLTSLIGFILALSIFLFTFMRFRARLTNSMATVYTASGIGLMCFMAWVLNRDFPPGLLQEFVKLPWPLT